MVSFQAETRTALAPAGSWSELLLEEVLPEVEAAGGRDFPGSAPLESESASGAEGEYYYNARYYDPDLGRFIQADSVLDGLNRYAYCHNNPVRYTDPTGQWLESIYPTYSMSDWAVAIGTTETTVATAGCFITWVANVLTQWGGRAVTPADLATSKTLFKDNTAEMDLTRVARAYPNLELSTHKWSAAELNAKDPNGLVNKINSLLWDTSTNSAVMVRVPYKKGDGKTNMHWVGTNYAYVDENGIPWGEISPTSDNDTFENRSQELPDQWKKMDGKVYVKLSAATDVATLEEAYDPDWQFSGPNTEPPSYLEPM